MAEKIIYNRKLKNNDEEKKGVKQMKKKILLALSFVLVAVLSVGLTFALLTYEDSDHNTMTIGQAKIDQLEYQRGEDGKLVEFVQDELLLPTTGTTSFTGDKQYWAEVGAEGWNELFGESLTNVKDKFVLVKNTGSVNVYYRTIIAIEAPGGTEINGESAIMGNFNGNLTYFDWDFIKLDNGNGDEEELTIEINGSKYYVIVANYTKELAPEEVSRPSLLQLYMRKEVTNDQIKLFGDKVDVLVVSQAVQASGYADYKTALNDAFGEISATNHPWVVNE